jgi:hypothetical protein
LHPIESNYYFDSPQHAPGQHCLKLLSPTKKYTDEELWQLVKQRLDRGITWTKGATKQLWLEKKLAKSSVQTPGKKGAHQVYYHLPTVLEPATGLDGG